MSYDYSDLERIDPLAFVAEHPERFFFSPNAPAHELATAIISCILVFDGQEVVSVRLHDWWVVGSEYDWIAPQLKTRTLDEYFRALVAFPESGDNSFHSEVFLTAFAADVVTFDQSSMSVIKGEPDGIDGVLQYRASRSWLKRVIAFRKATT